MCKVLHFLRDPFPPPWSVTGSQVQILYTDANEENQNNLHRPRANKVDGKLYCCGNVSNGVPSAFLSQNPKADPYFPFYRLPNQLPSPPTPPSGSVRLAEFFISFRQFSTSCVGCLLAGPDISRGTTSQREKIFVEVTGRAVDMGMKRTNEPKIRNETETSLKKKEKKKE